MDSCKIRGRPSHRPQHEIALGSKGLLHTLPEALPIAVITRFIGWFRDFGIPVGGVVVNMLIDQSQVKPDSPEFVRNRVAMQDRYMEEIWVKFEGMVRALLPLYETEVRGVPSLERMAGALFGERLAAAQ